MLQVWLPLNGNLNNQGLSSLNLSSTVTYASPGKIGQSCLNSQLGWFAVSEMAGKKQMSFAYWVKLNAGTTTNWLDPFSWYSTNGTSDSRSRQEFYYYNSNGNTEAMTTGVWYYNSSNSGLTQRKIGQWYHYAFTIDYDTGVTRFFCDGKLWKTTTNADTTHYIKGTNFLLRESALDCSISDFRLYDHILSDKEVEEIAKGLVLHYKLDDYVNDNLLSPIAKSYTPTAYQAYQLQMTENLVADQTYTVQLWDVDVYHSAKAASATGVWLYWGGGSVNLVSWKGPPPIFCGWCNELSC